MYPKILLSMWVGDFIMISLFLGQDVYLGWLVDGALFGFVSSVPLFHWWVFSWSSHLCFYSFYLLRGREAGWLLSETVLVPFKYLKNHQTRDILDFLKLYFATWETQKSVRELKAIELEAAKARSIVLVLKDRFLCLLWQFKLESSMPSFFLLCFLLLCSHSLPPPS